MSRTQPNSTAKLNAQLLRTVHWLLHRDKKPYYVNGRPRAGTLDTPHDLAKLATFDAAVEALNGGKNYTGLGLAISEGLQFIDLDKCRDPATGKLDAWAVPLLKAARKIKCFVEVSISGRGLHFVGHGRPFPSFRGTQVEAYCHGRYMALGQRVLVTGTDPLPDLNPLLSLMEGFKPTRPKPELRLVTGRTRWPVERVKIPRLLSVLNPDMDYLDWIRVGMAIHDVSGGAEDGLLLWDTWSAEGDKYKEGECARMWAGLKPGGGVTMGSLIHMSQQAEAEVSSPVIAQPQWTIGPGGRRKEFSDDELMVVEHQPIPWLVDGLICPGLTLMAAPPKMGKSYFVLQMALCVAAGVPFLNRATRRSKVSYFDLEEWEELLQRRRKRIGLAHQISKPWIRYAMELSGNGVTVHEDIQRHINDGSKLIIIDLLARVRDELTEDAKKNAYARDYEALRQFADMVLQYNPDVAIVIVHHTNKGQHDDWQSKISGSQGLAGASHCNMLLTHVDLRGLDDDARKEALHYRRLHVAGKAVEPDEMMLQMLPDGGGWGLSDKTTDEVKMQSKHAHILQVLREADGAWMTAKEVSALVEGTLDSIKKQLMRMAKKGEIVSSGSGGAGYRLA